jgi:hypothetical protein
MDEKYSLLLHENQHTTKELRAYLRSTKILLFIVLFTLFINPIVFYGLVSRTNLLGAETCNNSPVTMHGLSTATTPYLETQAIEHSSSTEVSLQKGQIAEVTEKGLSSGSYLKIHASL